MVRKRMILSRDGHDCKTQVSSRLHFAKSLIWKSRAPTAQDYVCRNEFLVFGCRKAVV